MKTSKRQLLLTLIALLASCNSQGARDKQTCALYNADKIDAVEALERLGLKANENGQRFEPVATTCAQTRQSPQKSQNLSTNSNMASFFNELS